MGRCGYRYNKNTGMMSVTWLKPVSLEEFWATRWQDWTVEMKDKKGKRYEGVWSSQSVDIDTVQVRCQAAFSNLHRNHRDLAGPTLDCALHSELAVKVRVHSPERSGYRDDVKVDKLSFWRRDALCLQSASGPHNHGSRMWQTNKVLE